MRYRLALRLVLLALGAALAGCARAAPSTAPAELQIDASEFTFEAPQTSYAVGTRYRFVVKNTGQLEHEWLIMPRGERDEDKALIEVEEDDLPTGATVVREVAFTQAGSFEFACHLPGHYEAGWCSRLWSANPTAAVLLRPRPTQAREKTAMVAMSILGLSWCQHAGWMVVLYDAASGRRLQITLRLEDALVLGQELSRQPTDRSGLYTLVGTLLRHQPQPASVNLSLAEAQRAGAALVVRTVDGQFGCPTSTADGIALAVRAGLPLFADEALLDSFGVGPDPDHPRDQHDAPSRPEIPHAFRLALGEQPDDAA